MPKKQSSIRQKQLRSAAITALILLVLAVAFIVLQLNTAAPPAPADQRMTLAPEIITNLTQLPQATPLAGEAADQLDALAALVEACEDYTPERRSQMQQHIAWLRAPAELPADIIIALGSNPPGKLIFGMATYTSIQWRLNDSPTESCLLPIGERLNSMLVAAGEPPFPDFPPGS